MLKDLTTPTEGPRNSSMVRYYAEQAFAAPFQTAGARFSDRMSSEVQVDAHGPRLALNADLALLERWYVDSLIEVAQFALFSDYRRVGEGYDGWAVRFLPSCRGVENRWHVVAERWPVLIQLLGVRGESLEASLTEMLERLRRDSACIAGQFGIDAASSLVGIQPGLSDPHFSGRTVMRLRFQCGAQLIYKPKAIDMEIALSDFTSAHGDEVGLTPLKMLGRSGYGWVEHADNAPIGASAISERLGKFAAFAWLLNTTDLHFENVFLNPEGAQIIDAETLLTATARHEARRSGVDWRRHSVAQTLLFNSGVGDDREKLNISGFAAAKSFASPIPRVRFTLINNAVEMRATPANTMAGGHRGDEGGVAVSAAATREICLAFEAFLRGNGPDLVKKFVEGLPDTTRLRFVPRATVFYDWLLQRMRQPAFLESGALLRGDLQRLYAPIPDGSVDADSRRWIVDEEIRQLIRGDIPYFSYEAGFTHITGVDHGIEDFFLQSAKRRALMKIESFEAPDIAEQTELLRTFFCADSSSAAPRRAPARGGAVLSDEAALLGLCFKLIETCFEPSDEPARWLSLLGQVSGEGLRCEVGDLSLYGGSLGIFAALQAAERVVKEVNGCERLSDFLDRQASKVVRSSLVSRPAGRDPSAAILGFGGIGGEIFAKALLRRAAPDRWCSMTMEIAALLDAAEPLIAADPRLDVIGGAAGLALVADFLASAPDNDAEAQRARETMAACGHRLTQAAIHLEGALAWKTPGEAHPLLGFAHGWSGAVAALSVCAREALGAENRIAFRDAIERARELPERLWHRDGAWLDYRDATSLGTPLNASWCHGSAGLARGLLAVHGRSLSEPSHLTLLDTATALGPQKDSFRFCCGELGRVDLALEISRRDRDVSRVKATTRRTLDLLRDVAATYPRAGDGVAHEWRFPGLYQGAAGALYVAARCLDSSIPSLSGRLTMAGDR